MEALEQLLELRKQKETEIKDLDLAIEKINESLYCNYVDRYFSLEDEYGYTVFHIISVHGSIATVDIVYDNTELGKIGFEMHECMAIKNIIAYTECSKFEYNKIIELVSDKIIQQQIQ